MMAKQRRRVCSRTASRARGCGVWSDDMHITSSAFGNGNSIPERFTIDGAGEFPPLTLSDVPPTAVTVAVIVDDPDVPIERIPSGVFDHWVCWNLPPATAIIDAPQASGGTHGSNSRGTRQYVLPAPPIGDGEHRYYFRAYALDTRIELAAGATKAELLTAMAGHVVDSAELMGRYRRRG